MMDFWLSPVGELYGINYDGTYDIIEVPEENRSSPWELFKSVPNGNRGRIAPVDITQTIEVYPAKWDAHYAAFPRKTITFVHGVLITNESQITWKERYEALKRWVKKTYEY